MTTIIAVSPSNIMDEENMKYLLASAASNNFTVDIIGLNKPFTYLSKITLLHEYLQATPGNPIVCYTDAFDVFYLDNLDTIRDKFLAFKTDIVWSVERWYSFQLATNKAFYDTLDQGNPSPYKYINTGTFMGYKESLLRLTTDIIQTLEDPELLAALSSGGYTLASAGVDQTIISYHLAKHWNRYSIALDRTCRIFYLPSGDWDDIDRHITYGLRVTETGQTPSIIHVSWKAKTEHILRDLFNRKYTAAPLINKSYSWERSQITFCADGKMTAFGAGQYEHIDSTTVRAVFGHRTHILHFTGDYQQFVSVRKGDNQIVQGLRL